MAKAKLKGSGTVTSGKPLSGLTQEKVELPNAAKYKPANIQPAEYKPLDLKEPDIQSAGQTINQIKSINAVDPGALPDPGKYKSTVSPVIDNLVQNVANRKDFSYDADLDPAYQAYAQKYQRLGANARENTMADVAANTGGMVSSFAAAAASQAQNDYNQQLTDMIPQLMQAAYDRYNTDRNYDLSAMSTLQGIDDSRYGQFATDRQYGLDAWQAQANDYLNRMGFNLDLANSIEGQRQFEKQYGLDVAGLEEERRNNMFGNNLDLAGLNETIRNNVFNNNVSRYDSRTGRISANETKRSNKANEKNDRKSIKETKRHNKATEKIDKYNAKTSRKASKK